MVLDFDGEVAAAAAAAVDEGGGSVCEVIMDVMGGAEGGGGAEWRADATARYLKGGRGRRTRGEGVG
jgi:hypothetical protein